MSAIWDQLVKGNLDVDVKHETQDHLELVWISVMRADLTKIVKPRSVVLHLGMNRLKLQWNPRLLTSGPAAWAGIFLKPDDDKPVGKAMIMSGNVNMLECDTVTLLWELNMLGPLP